MLNTVQLNSPVDVEWKTGYLLEYFLGGSAYLGSGLGGGRGGGIKELFSLSTYHPTTWRSCCSPWWSCCCVAHKVRRGYLCCLLYSIDKCPNMFHSYRRVVFNSFLHVIFFFSIVLSLKCYTCQDENDTVCKTVSECHSSNGYCRTYQKGLSNFYCCFNHLVYYENSCAKVEEQF